MAAPSSFGAAAWLFVELPAADVLRALAGDVEREAALPALLPRPGISDARRIAFCRRLTSDFENQFGQPMYATVARFGAALLDDVEITEDMVRKLHARTQSKRK
jgi:hypothetical protein